MNGIPARDILEIIMEDLVRMDVVENWPYVRRSDQHPKNQNRIIYYLHTQAHKRNTNKSHTLGQSNYTNTK